jgi:hypothetical protein
MSVVDIFGTAAGIGFLAGIRLYATVFVLGLLIRFGLIGLSDQFSSLLHLGSLPVLITSGVLMAAEFIADKVPWFDSFWDTVHTFVRPIGAGVLAFAAGSGLDPALRTAVILVTGGVALTAHSAKAATRVAANHSPEPVSNWALSFAEDMFIPLGLWLTVHHPLIVLVLVVLFLVGFIWLIRRVLRFLVQRLRIPT